MRNVKEKLFEIICAVALVIVFVGIASAEHNLITKTVCPDQSFNADYGIVETGDFLPLSVKGGCDCSIKSGEVIQASPLGWSGSGDFFSATVGNVDSGTYIGAFDGELDCEGGGGGGGGDSDSPSWSGKTVATKSPDDIVLVGSDETCADKRVDLKVKAQNGTIPTDCDPEFSAEPSDAVNLDATGQGKTVSVFPTKSGVETSIKAELAGCSSNATASKKLMINCDLEKLTLSPSKIDAGEESIAKAHFKLPTECNTKFESSKNDGINIDPVNATADGNVAKTTISTRCGFDGSGGEVDISASATPVEKSCDTSSITEKLNITDLAEDCEVDLTTEKDVILLGQRATVFGGFQCPPGDIECNTIRVTRWDRNRVGPITNDNGEPAFVNSIILLDKYDSGKTLSDPFNTAGTYYLEGIVDPSENPDCHNQCNKDFTRVDVVEIQINEVEIVDASGSTKLKGRLGTNINGVEVKLLANGSFTSDQYGSVIDTTNSNDGKFALEFNSDKLLNGDRFGSREMKVVANVGDNNLAVDVSAFIFERNRSFASNELTYIDKAFISIALPILEPGDAAPFVRDFRGEIRSKSGHITFNTPRQDIDVKGYNRFVRGMDQGELFTNIRVVGGLGDDLANLDIRYSFSGVSEWYTPLVDRSKKLERFDYSSSTNTSPTESFWYNTAEYASNTAIIDAFGFAKLKEYRLIPTGIRSDRICVTLPPEEKNCSDPLYLK